MLFRRILSAAVLALLLFVAILRLDSAWLSLVLAAPALLALREWVLLAGLRRGAVGGCVLGALVLMVCLHFYAPPSLHFYLLLAAVPCWIGGFCLLPRAAARLSAAPSTAPAVTAAPMLVAPGIAAVVAAWLALVDLHGLPQHGAVLLLLLLALVWLADGAAFVAGKTWGKTPLAPRLSPAKTVAGAGGALLAALVLALVSAALWPELLPHGAAWVGLCLACALVGIAGDLAESALKRRAGVKDSGTLIPGHGGVLDRTDSLLAAAPFYAVGIRLLQA